MDPSPPCSGVFCTPELVLEVLFLLPKRHDVCQAALVCRLWSQIAPEVLWYEVDDICALFNVLAPLRKFKTIRTSRWAFERRPGPKDWIRFQAISRRVKKLTVTSQTAIPNRSVFEEVCRTRTEHKILPNLRSLIWYSQSSYGTVFLHSGIRELGLLMNFEYRPDMALTIENAATFSPNLTTLYLQPSAGSPGPHPIGYIEAELCDWLAQLHDLRRLCLPKHWLTTEVFRALSQLPHLSQLHFRQGQAAGYGSPLDTMIFDPSTHRLDFPSLTDFSQSAPFPETVQFISSWPGSSHITSLFLASQILETPESYGHALSIIAGHCPQLTSLGLTSLVTPFYQPPERLERPRITLDTLLPLRTLNHLASFEIHHALPLALSDYDFRVLIQGWSNMTSLSFGCDPYPLASDAIHTAVSSLDIPRLTGNATPAFFPVMGLLSSIDSLRTFCPLLKDLRIYGEDDFDDEDDGDDDPELSPFPNLVSLCFGTSLFTSEPSTVALILSRYLLPTTTVGQELTWGADAGSPYLVNLNLENLFSVYDDLPLHFQTLLDLADSTPSNQDWFKKTQNPTSGVPIGVNGVLPTDMSAEIGRREITVDQIWVLIRIASEARKEEREKLRRHIIRSNLEKDYLYVVEEL